MRNKVSALMDGELDDHEVEHVLTALKKQEELHDDWKTFHLIGDTLRHSTKLSTNISSDIDAKLAAEPTILAPHQSKYSDRKTFTFAIAASLAAVVVTTWFSLQNTHQPPLSIIADQTDTEKNIPVASNTPTPPLSIHARPLASAEINDYLFVHREFSPGAMTYDRATYVRPVTNSQERYDR